MSGTEPKPLWRSESELSVLEREAFASMYWERRPFTTCDRRWIPCSTEALHEALQEAARQLLRARLPRAKDIQCYVDDAEVVSPAPFMPRANETTFQDFLGRLKRDTVGKPFTLMVHGVQQFSATVTEQLRRYLLPINEALGGTPSGGTDVHLMVARYGTSPYGIHKDTNSVLTTVYFGQKTILVWPYEHFSGEVEHKSGERLHIKLPLVKVSEHRATAHSLHATAGSTIYFPASAWHVGSAEADDVHVSLHVTFGTHIDRTAVAREVLEELGSSRLAGSAWAPTVEQARYSSERGWTLADPFVENSVAALATEMANSAHVLRKAAASRWLRRQSIQGLLRGAVSACASDGTTWTEAAVDHGFGFYWSVIDDEILVAANGRVIAVPNLDWVRGELTALSSSTASGLSPIECKTSIVSAKCRPLYDALASIGGVTLS